ncbi:hypothetical protein JCM3774_002626 [Rhodotorula dairenensis]
MPHSGSLSHAADPAQQPPVASSSSSSFNIPMPPPPSQHARPQRPLGKATSFADLRIGKTKLFKRFHHRRGDFDFGCAGEESTADEGQLGARDEGAYARELPPPLPTKSVRLYDTSRQSSNLPQASTSALPPVPPPRPAPYRFPLTAPPNVEELRRLEREREQALAAQAALDYMQTSSHARKSSRSSSMAQGDGSGGLAAIIEGVQQLGGGTAPSMSRTPSHATSSSAIAHDAARLGPAAPVLERSHSSHSRSASVVSTSDQSTSSSSRPRTNDSLPSFVETASTVDSTGSFPPSPVQSPPLRTRPTHCGNGLPPAAVKVDLEAVAHQPRGYSFI